VLYGSPEVYRIELEVGAAGRRGLDTIPGVRVRDLQ
jgi:hypothetical protein